jgi:exodeoxyribonuclease VII large subunit
VISAVGHEIDWTICDLVADLRAPTPSAAAELVVQNREELENRVRDYQIRMRNAVLNLLQSLGERFETLRESYAFKQPGVLIQQFSQRVDELLRQLQNYLKSLVTAKGQTFETLAGRLHALSPLAILGRGYSLSFREDGTLVKDSKSTKVGESLVTRLARGVLYSKVTKINPEKMSSPHDFGGDPR